MAIRLLSCPSNLTYTAAFEKAYNHSRGKMRCVCLCMLVLHPVIHATSPLIKAVGPGIYAPNLLVTQSSGSTAN